MEETREEYLERIRKEWNKDSDTWYPIFRTDERIEKLIKNPESSFQSGTYAMIQKYLPDLKGKRILVPSSGDNLAVFSFAQLGAHVTSSDMAERQLENAAEVAKKYGWDIEFIQDNTMRLDNIKSGEYDLVYTSNGVHVWLYDIAAMYQNVYRVLKPGGYNIMFDIHPFQRSFANNELRVIKPYTEIAPHYHWRVQDFLNAMLRSGLSLLQVEEMMPPEDSEFWLGKDGQEISKAELGRLNDWRTNPIAALPAWLSVCSLK